MNIFNNLNQTSTAKEIWDNIEMLMQGSGRTIQQRKEDLFDEYERFRAIRNESRNKSSLQVLLIHWPMLLTPHLHLFFHHPQLRATMTQVANLLSGFQKQFPPTNNQLRTSSNSRTHATVHDGHIVTEPVQRKAPGNIGNTGARGKKMLKLKRAQPVLYDAGTLLHPTHYPVSIWDSEEVLVHQVVSMKKMNEKPGHVRPENGFYKKLNALMFVPQQELSREQAYWLPVNEIASQASNPNRPVTPFVHNRPPPSQVLANLQKVNAVFHQLEGIIKERTTQKPLYVSEWCFDYAK
ncbi:hypothetical protein Tco_1581065 [Tanacetum coccineum]